MLNELCSGKVIKMSIRTLKILQYYQIEIIWIIDDTITDVLYRYFLEWLITTLQHEFY